MGGLSFCMYFEFANANMSRVGVSHFVDVSDNLDKLEAIHRRPDFAVWLSAAVHSLTHQRA